MMSMEFGKHDQTLLAVISQYQTMAMVSLGKVQNPVTGKVERDLEQAHMFIDILEMLKVKCRTDTPEDLLRMLDSAVMDLQLNFLDEKKKDATSAEDDGTTEAENKDEAEAKGEAGAKDEAKSKDEAGETSAGGDES